MASNRNTLKAYFNPGDRPTDTQFADLIDSTVNVNDKATDSEIDAGTNDDKFITVRGSRRSARKSITVNGLAPNISTGDIQLTTITGNSGTASKLVTPRTINGVAFDGSQNINIPLLNSDNSIIMFGGGTVLTTFGCTALNIGTVSHPSAAFDNKLNAIQKVKFTSLAAPGSLAGTTSTVLECGRGSVSGLGGFSSTVRFGLSTIPSGIIRAFIGLTSKTTPTNIDPMLASTESKIGMAINTNGGNWKLVHNLGGPASTTPSTIDLGVNFPINITDFYELYLYCLPNSNSISYQIKNLITGNLTPLNVITSPNLPLNSVSLCRSMWLTNNATGTAASIDLNKWILEKN